MFCGITPLHARPQEKRYAAYIERLAAAAAHEDRHSPLKNYCMGLLLEGERKSIEPMAARLAPENVQAMRQSLHHLVAKAPWSDEAILAEIREQTLPAMQKQGPVVAWIVDDTGFPKKGRHSVGVTRRYCGQVGKQENCRVAVSLSVATWNCSLPVAYRLYLPKEWTEDAQIVDRGLDPQNEPELIVQFQRYRTHGVLDPRAFNADVEPIPHFPFVLRVKFATQKGGDVVRLDSMYRRPGQILVHRRHVRPLAKNDVGRVLALVHAPVILDAEGPEDRAIRPGKVI